MLQTNIGMRIKAVILMFLISTSLVAQGGRKMTRKEYIETYKDLAMREMEYSGIPASITLAQGMLESGDGNSRLARKANNHFGIKCHDWNGKSVKHDDDSKNECFRKYKSVEESYRDHTEFLTGRNRYAKLFELEQDDYKGWAKELKKAGYATSPTYANALIKLIEENELYQYDAIVIAKGGGVEKRKKYSDVEYAGGRQIKYVNRVKYVLAREGDTFDDLSTELDLFAWQLPKYNELPDNYVFAEGERVFLQPKRSKADVKNKTHMVEERQTIHQIAQLYGVKEEKIRLKNSLEVDQEPEVGEIVFLRKRQNKKLKIKDVVKNIELSEEPEEEFKVVIEELDE